MDPWSLRTLQDLALSTAEQGSTPVSVPPPLRDSDRDPLIPVSRFDPQTVPKKGSQKTRDLMNRNLSSVLYRSSVVLPFFKRQGKKSVSYPHPRGLLKKRCM